MPTAAFINALAEEGTKAEAISFLQKEWDENCILRAALREILGLTGRHDLPDAQKIAAMALRANEQNGDR